MGDSVAGDESQVVEASFGIENNDNNDKSDQSAIDFGNKVNRRKKRPALEVEVPSTSPKIKPRKSNLHVSKNNTSNNISQ
jgi:hypothetical protein